MKRLLIPLILITLFILGALFWWKKNIRPVSNDSTLERFVIPKGYSASQIGNKLADKNFIKSSFAFKFYVQVTAKSKKVQAGEYLLSPGFSLFELVDQLIKGPVEVWVTIPEGLRREEVVERHIDALEKGEDKQSFGQEFLSLTSGKEGFLFPDTYLFPKTASASAVVKTMLSTFDQRVDEQMQADINVSDYTLFQIITLASLIERETKTNEERPLVAGILWKRLETGWPLQVDATVQYAIATSVCGEEFDCDWWPILTKDNLKLSSSYNTYEFAGLPPAPIANPGLSSIKAATYPEESPYWFYLHDSKGKIHYAETLEEHNENIRIYLNK